MPPPIRGPWHDEAIRWLREGISTDEAAERWGIECSAARQRLVRAAEREGDPAYTRSRISSAEAAARQARVIEILKAGGGTHDVADEFGLSTCRASTIVCRARKLMNGDAPQRSYRKRKFIEPRVSPSEPAPGGRMVSLSEAVGVDEV